MAPSVQQEPLGAAGPGLWENARSGHRMENRQYREAGDGGRTVGTSAVIHPALPSPAPRPGGPGIGRMDMQPQGEGAGLPAPRLHLLVCHTPA